MPWLTLSSGLYSRRKIQFGSEKNVRPTSAKNRSALMNMIRGDLSGALFFDLFAGSGAVGIEALGNGAEATIWVEQNSKEASFIRKNIADLKINTLQNRIVMQDVFTFLKLNLLAQNAVQFLKSKFPGNAEQTHKSPNTLEVKKESISADVMFSSNDRLSFNDPQKKSDAPSTDFFPIVFLDPPYHTYNLSELLELLFTNAQALRDYTKGRPHLSALNLGLIVCLECQQREKVVFERILFPHHVLALKNYGETFMGLIQL